MKDQLLYVKQGQEALRKATRILENKDGWNVELTEVGQTDVKFLSYFYRSAPDWISLQQLSSAERDSAPSSLLLEQWRCNL